MIMPSDLTDTCTDWAGYFLSGNDNALPAYAYQLYSFATTAKSWMLQLVEQVSHKPDLATIALILVIVLVSLKLLDMLWQTMLFWLRLLKTVLFWGGLVALALWMWSRGPDGMMVDMEHWWGVWNQEYGYWKERERVARLVHQGRNYAGQQGWF